MTVDEGRAPAPGVINAMASVVGAISFVVMLELGVPAWLRLVLTVAITASLRWVALWRNWHAPVPVDVVAMVRRRRPRSVSVKVAS